MRAWLATALVILSVATARGADLAEPLPPAEVESPWSVRLQTYMWAAGLSGETRPLPNAPIVDVDLRFSDILEQLKFAGMALGSVHYGRFGVAGDVQYVVIRSSSDALDPLFGRARVTSKTFIGTALGDYKAYVDERFTLIASAGVRAYSVESDIELTPGLLPGLQADGSDTWVDPMVGVRGNVAITPKIYANGWAYVGGFGLGSDFAADLYAGVGYRITDNITSTLGYRWLRIDRDIGSFVYDVTQQGVMAGLTVSF